MMNNGSSHFIEFVVIGTITGSGYSHRKFYGSVIVIRFDKANGVLHLQHNLNPVTLARIARAVKYTHVQENENLRR